MWVVRVREFCHISPPCLVVASGGRYLLVVQYTGPIIRPPGEARSLLLQVMGGDVVTKSMARIDGELIVAAKLGPAFSTVFLCDAAAITMSAHALAQILIAIRVRLPWITRVGMYGDANGVETKSLAELKQLHALGLATVYHRLEAEEGRTARSRQTHVDGAGKLRAADICHAVTVTLGYGDRVVRETARLLTAMDPARLIALTASTSPHTPLPGLSDAFELLEELYTIIDESELSTCLFSAHDPLPLEARLPEDREPLLRILGDFLDVRDPSTLRTEAWAAVGGRLSS